MTLSHRPRISIITRCIQSPRASPGPGRKPAPEEAARSLRHARRRQTSCAPSDSGVSHSLRLDLRRRCADPIAAGSGMPDKHRRLSCSGCRPRPCTSPHVEAADQRAGFVHRRLRFATSPRSPPTTVPTHKAVAKVDADGLVTGNWSVDIAAISVRYLDKSRVDLFHRHARRARLRLE